MLQAYCVYNLLRLKYPQSKVEIIDLVPKNRGDNEKNFFKKTPPFVRFEKLAKYRSMRRFWKNRVNFSPYSKSENLNDQISFINSQNYDAIFTGSDTVWMHSSKLNYQLPHIYFLPIGIKSKKYAIAASSDPLKSRAPYLEKASVLKETLAGYSSILVRDRLTFDLISELGVEIVKEICDPTLLFPFEKALNITVSKTGPINKENVHLAIGDKGVKEKVKKLLVNDGNLNVVEFEEKSDMFFGDHIVDYLNEYSRIHILITDRFHRSIFAMKLSNALVINIEHYVKNPIPYSKGRDLFGKLGISEYCIRYEKNGEKELISNILGLIKQWDNHHFIQREQNLIRFIESNQKVWEEVI